MKILAVVWTFVKSNYDQLEFQILSVFFTLSVFPGLSNVQFFSSYKVAKVLSQWRMTI